jgi:hypothetical protein
MEVLTASTTFFGKYIIRIRSPMCKETLAKFVRKAGGGSFDAFASCLLLEDILILGQCSS